MSGRARDEIVLVPTERHVERLARAGARAETRARFVERLVREVARDVIFATEIERRVALACVLEEVAASDELLAPVRRAGGPSWSRTIDAIDRAIGAVRAQGERTDDTPRGRTVRASMRALDARLEKAGLVDDRRAREILAARVGALSPADVARAVGVDSVVARYLVTWEVADVAWWRALDSALVRTGGGARIELPSFDAPIDASRGPDPLDVLLDDLARALDGPPSTARIEATLGDLRCEGAVPPDVAARTSLWRGADADAQARAVVDVVLRALESGAAIDDVAVALPRVDEETVRTLRRAFRDVGIAASTPHVDTLEESALARVALDALAIGPRGLAREDVAALLRSPYPSAFAIAGEGGKKDVADLARALEETHGIEGDDPAKAFLATVRASRGDEDRVQARVELASKVASILLGAPRSATRAEHVAAARALWASLGLRAERGLVDALAVMPRPPHLRADLSAIARDARAWDALADALDACSVAASRVGASRDVVPAEAFRHELAAIAFACLAPRPAARAGALRVSRFDELAGESLALLVVVDANDGALPASPSVAGLVSEHDDPRVHEARSLASLAMAAAGAERVVLTWKSRDSEGALLAHAPIVAWLERGGIEIANFRAAPLVGDASSPHEANLRRLARGELTAADADVSRRAGVELAREQFFEIRGGPDAVHGKIALDDEATRVLRDATGGGDRSFGATSLESFAECAFRGFAQHVLRARPRQPRSEIPDSLESGTILHAVLAAAFLATRELWAARPRDADRIRAMALEAVDAHLRTSPAASMLRHLALDRLRANAARVVEWSVTDEDWDFSRAEQRFGYPGEDSWPTLVIDDGTTRVSMLGAIDRVDVGHGRDAVRVIDYKSGIARSHASAKSLGDTTFQVALYARVAGDALRAAARTGRYLACGAPDKALPRDYEKNWAESHEAVGTVTRIEARALGLLRAVREGDLSPQRVDEARCIYCDHSGGCRRPRFSIPRPEDDDAK